MSLARQRFIFGEIETGSGIDLPTFLRTVQGEQPISAATSLSVRNLFAGSEWDI
jgi:hypothetical protein